MTRHKKVNEAVARPARTAIQATPAWLLTELLDSFVNLNERQFTLVVLLLTMLFSYVQTQIENNQGKGLLRQVPPKTAPVIDE